MRSILQWVAYLRQLCITVLLESALTHLSILQAETLPLGQAETNDLGKLDTLPLAAPPRADFFGGGIPFERES